MSIRNKIFYFGLGVLFAASLGWNFYRPVEAVAPSRVERKVTILSDREIARMKADVAALEKSIQEDRDFLTTKFTAYSGKGGWSSAHAERRSTIEQNLPEKEKNLQELKDQMKTLRM